MPKKETSDELLSMLPDSPSYAALRELQGQEQVCLGDPVAAPKAMTPHVDLPFELADSEDRLAAALVGIEKQLAGLHDTPDLGEALHMALNLAQDALLIAATIRGALPGVDFDARAHYRDTLARARLCVLGYPTTDQGKRAYVHDLLLDWVERFDFKNRTHAAQEAVAEHLGGVLVARVGTECKVEAGLVREALNTIVTPEGRPKGSTVANEKAETAAVKKWTVLRKLFGALRLAGPPVEGIESEVRETKKSMRVGRRLREL